MMVDDRLLCGGLVFICLYYFSLICTVLCTILAVSTIMAIEALFCTLDPLSLSQVHVVATCVCLRVLVCFVPTCKSVL